MARMQRRFKVDLWFGGRRLNRASGATTPAEHRKRKAFLTWLSDTGRTDILDAIIAGTLTINEAYGAHGAGKLAFVASDVALQRNLWSAVAAWVPSSAPAPATRIRYGKAFRALERYGALSPGLQVRSLELVDWVALLNRWPSGPTGWNHMRSALSRFLTMTLGDKWHPFRRAVLAKVPRADEPPSRVPDLSPDLFQRILARIPEALRPCYVTLVATGMRPGEYVRCEATDLLPHTLSLRVPGTKTAASAATVRLEGETFSWATRAIPCPVTQDALYRYWKAACRAEGCKELRLYDLRHAYGQWLSDSGAPEAHIQAGLRHKTAAMTRRYTMQRDRGKNAVVLAKVLGFSSRRNSRRASGAGRGKAS